MAVLIKLIKLGPNTGMATNKIGTEYRDGN